MNIFKNKQLLSKAIDNYEPYTQGQKSLLKNLVNISIEGTATIGTSYLTEKTSLSRAAIYLNLKKFVIEGTINKIRKPAERQDSYQLNEKKLEHILQL